MKIEIFESWANQEPMVMECDLYEVEGNGALALYSVDWVDGVLGKIKIALIAANSWQMCFKKPPETSEKTLDGETVTTE